MNKMICNNCRERFWGTIDDMFVLESGAIIPVCKKCSPKTSNNDTGDKN